MKLNLQLKMFLYMIASVLFFVVLLIFSSSFLVEKYYLNDKIDFISENAEIIANIVSEKEIEEETMQIYFSDDEMKKLIEIQSQGIFVDIQLDMDSELAKKIEIDNEAIYNTVYPNILYIERADTIEGSIPVRATSSIDSSNIRSIKSSGKMSLEIIGENGEESVLRYKNTLDNGIFLVMWTTMKSISEQIDILNKLIRMIVLVVIIFTIIWAFFVSHKFTKPIIEINKVTNKMKNLDFSEQIEVVGNDEIALMSENINHLSESLDRTITELNEKNIKLEADIDKERKIDKMRRDFISSVSHELKTPIFLIQGYADGLMTKIADDPKKRNYYCQVISEETEKMNMLVKDLLLISRYESGEEKLNKINFNFSEHIDSIIKKYEISLAEKEINITYEKSGDIFIYGDPVKLEQVVTNFINNAIEHIDSDKELKITLVEKDEGLKFSVFNSGKNIDEDEISKIWNSFYKKDEARTRTVGGAGVGLSIVKAILESHGYSYGVTNEENGVAFWFEAK